MEKRFPVELCNREDCGKQQSPILLRPTGKYSEKRTYPILKVRKKEGSVEDTYKYADTNKGYMEEASLLH